MLISSLQDKFSTHGLPETIVTDKDIHLSSALFQDFYQSHNITHVYSPSDHPQSNDQTKRLVDDRNWAPLCPKISSEKSFTPLAQIRNCYVNCSQLNLASTCATIVDIFELQRGNLANATQSISNTQRQSFLIINATELPGPIKSFGFSLSSGGLDLDVNGYPDLAVGAPESNKMVVFRTRPVIRVKVFVVREDGSSHVGQKLDTLEDCTRDTQILPGYWAPRVHCMNVKILATFTPVDPADIVQCSQQTIPIRLLLAVNPPEHWLKEDFSNITVTASGDEKASIASLFGEKVLKISDPEVRIFYQRSAGNNCDNMPENSDESLPFLLLLNSQRAICRDHSVPVDTPPTPSELAQAATVRLAFRFTTYLEEKEK
ncbi:hypothetical protein ACTXT7_012961 [Hymenolepis weldensis]